MPGLPESQQALAAAPEGFSAGMTGPENAARQFFKDFSAAAPLLIAVSGGSDSTGLLLAFHDAAIANGRRLLAATVDHRLRQGSAQEAVRVGALCARLGIEHFTLDWSGDKPATGLQAAARLARYRLLADLAARTGSAAIVTGHTADDQAETIAMRSTRSQAGAVGLSGMASAVLVDSRAWVVRPFLGIRRDEIRAFLNARSVGWIDDPSNDNAAFERVKVRAGLAGSQAVVQSMEKSANRQALADAAAEFLLQALDFPDGHVARIDLSAGNSSDPAHRIALETVIAIAGGQKHRPGRRTAKRVHDFVAAGQPGRLTAARAVVDLRREGLYIYRENRGLESIRLAAGETAIWDGRFEISNAGASEITIGSCRKAPALFVPIGPDPVPDGVMARALAGLPAMIEGADPGRQGCKRVLSLYNDFLPGFELGLANALAARIGLPLIADWPAKLPA